MFLITRKKHIWQYFRKNFYQMPTVFCSITVFDEKVYVFQKTFSPYFSYRHVGRSFDNPAEKNCEKHLKNSIKIPTLWKKLTIFWKTSLWMFLLNTYNAVLLTPLDYLLHKTEKFLLHFRRCWFFSKKGPCHQTFPADTWNPNFTNPPENLRQKNFRSIKQFGEKRNNSRGKNFWKCF